MARKRAQPAQRALPSLTYVECHALGHSWQHKGPLLDGSKVPMGIEFGSVALLSICAGCHTQRTRFVTRSGQRYKPKYEYPDGYASRGDDRRTPQEWVSGFVSNLFDQGLIPTDLKAVS